MLIDEVTQDGEKVRHCFASSWLATLDDTERNTFLRQLACVIHELRETPTVQTTRPPQPKCRGDRRLYVVIAEADRRAPNAVFDQHLKARRPLALPTAHRAHQRAGGRAEPRPQRPHPVPRMLGPGARLADWLPGD